RVVPAGVDREQVSAGSGNCQRVGDYQMSVSEQDRRWAATCQRRSEGDGRFVDLPSGGFYRLPQRAIAWQIVAVELVRERINNENRVLPLVGAYVDPRSACAVAV